MHLPGNARMTAKITAEDLRSSFPDVTSTLSSAELDFPVTIIRDNFGIPRASLIATATLTPQRAARPRARELSWLNLHMCWRPIPQTSKQRPSTMCFSPRGSSRRRMCVLTASFGQLQTLWAASDSCLLCACALPCKTHCA